MKKKIQFLFNKPQLSENIGMSIRSLGCFGFDEVSLVSPKKKCPNDKRIRASKHFELIAKKVKTFKKLNQSNSKFEINMMLSLIHI